LCYKIVMSAPEDLIDTQMPFVIEGTASPRELDELQARLVGILPTGITINFDPEKVARTREGHLKSLLERVGDDYFVSSLALNRFANALPKDGLGKDTMEQRARTAYKTIAEHIKLFHLQEDAATVCDCPLHGHTGKRQKYKGRGHETVYLDPSSFLLAMEGSATSAVARLPLTNSWSGPFAEPGTRNLYSSPAFRILEAYSEALRS